MWSEISLKSHNEIFKSRSMGPRLFVDWSLKMALRKSDRESPKTAENFNVMILIPCDSCLPELVDDRDAAFVWPCETLNFMDGFWDANQQPLWSTSNDVMLKEP